MWLLLLLVVWLLLSFDMIYLQVKKSLTVEETLKLGWQRSQRKMNKIRRLKEVYYIVPNYIK